MFRKDLETRLKKIFDFKKTTFLAPSESFEQDTLFIDIEVARTRVSRSLPSRETAYVRGALTVYSQDNRLPFGFFNKRIEQADRALKKNLFFFDVDTDIVTSPARMQNIHERRTGFIFLYDAQYDPNQGQLTSLEF